MIKEKLLTNSMKDSESLDPSQHYLYPTGKSQELTNHLGTLTEQEEKLSGSHREIYAKQRFDCFTHHVCCKHFLLNERRCYTYTIFLIIF